MLHNSNEYFTQHSESLMAECIKQTEPLISLLRFTCNAIDCVIDTHLNALFLENKGLEIAFSQFRNNALEDDPKFFKSSYLRVSDTDFEGFNSTIDFRTNIILFDALRSSLLDVSKLKQCSFFDDGNGRSLTLFVKGDSNEDSLGVFNYNLDRSLLTFSNTRDYTFVKFPNSMPILNESIVLGVNPGTYDISSLINMNENFLITGRSSPQSIVSVLGSDQQYKELTELALVNILTDEKFDHALALDLFKSYRFKTFSSDTQRLLNIVNRTEPDNINLFMDQLLQLSMRDEMPFLNFIQAQLIDEWLERLTGLNPDQRAFLETLSSIKNYADRGYFYQDKIGLLMSNYEDVKYFEGCISLSNALDLAVEQDFSSNSSSTPQQPESDLIFSNAI